jgi:hypothetical protein
MTPIPSATGFVFRLPTRIPPTRTPVPAAPPSAGQGHGSTCQAALDYEASVHDYYVTYYRNYYEPWFDYYNRLIDYAARTGDALMLAQAQAGLKEAKADLQSYLNQESKRHNKEVASIKAYCP